MSGGFQRVSCSSEIITIFGTEDELSPSFKLQPQIRDKDGTTFRSAQHYVFYHVLLELECYDEAKAILSIESALTCSLKMKEAIDNLFLRDVDRLKHLSSIKERVLNRALDLRFEEDALFRTKLMNTGQALLVLCERTDLDNGIGLNPDEFLTKVSERGFAAQDVFELLMENHRSRDELGFGSNKYGLALMMLRERTSYQRMTSLHSNASERWTSEKQMAASQAVDRSECNRRQSNDHGDVARTKGSKKAPNFTYSQRLLTSDTGKYSILDELSRDISLGIENLGHVSNEIITFSAMYRPLSNIYVSEFSISDEPYKSVESYCNYQLLLSLGYKKLAQKVLLIRNTLALGAFMGDTINDMVASKPQLFAGNRTRSFRQVLNSSCLKAIRSKIKQRSDFKDLLLSTGHALLVECNVPDDMEWSVGFKEVELRSLCTSHLYTSNNLLKYFLNLEDLPGAEPPVLGLNMTGVILMALRHELRSKATLIMSPLCICNSNLTTDYQLDSNPMALHWNGPFGPVSPCNFSFDGVEYSSVHQFVCARQCEVLRFEPKIRKEILDALNPAEQHRIIQDAILQSWPPVHRLNEWYHLRAHSAYYDAFKAAYEQNDALKKSLDDTGNSLLLFCDLPSTVTRNWTVGMSYDDFIRTLTSLKVSPLQYFNFMLGKGTIPSEIIGFNRLGLLLMELREFFRSGKRPDVPKRITRIDVSRSGSKPRSSQHIDGGLTEKRAKPMESSDTAVFISKHDDGDKSADKQVLASRSLPEDPDLDEFSFEEMVKFGKDLAQSLIRMRGDASAVEKTISGLDKEIDQVKIRLSKFKPVQQRHRRSPDRHAKPQPTSVVVVPSTGAVQKDRCRSRSPLRRFPNADSQQEFRGQFFHQRRQGWKRYDRLDSNSRQRAPRGRFLPQRF